MDIITLAREFATKAHDGQTRWGGEPYIMHPEAVAKAVSVYGDPHYTAAAWLHDVVEDCGVTLEQLTALGMPDAVVDAIALLSHVPGDFYLDYILRLKGNDIALLVKVADIRHNLSTSVGLKNKTTIRDKWMLALHILEN